MELTLDQALKKGIEAHKAGQAQEADRLYTAILKAQPKHPDANHNMGVLAVGVGKVQEALPFFKTALEANPSIDQYWLSYIDALIKLDRLADAEAAFDRAKKNGVKGDRFDKLELQLKRSGTKVQDPPRGRLQHLINLYSKGYLQQALAKATLLLQQYPKSFILYNFIGGVNQGLGQFDSAIASYKRALTIKPDYANAYNDMGIALKKINRVEEAIEAYNKAITIEPDFAVAFRNIGIAFNDQGKIEKAIEAYSKAITIKPDYAEAKHMVSALSGDTTNTAPREYIEKLFDSYAAGFETSLVGLLEYNTPQTLADIVINQHSNGSLGSVLDLGCGTGLAGIAVRQFCTNLEGIDLSGPMLEQAKLKNVYDKLTHVDIIDYLSSTKLNFDCFIATDVFIYMGNLTDLFRLIKARNKRPGRLVFSTEHTEKNGFHLQETGRYSHSQSYIHNLCKQFNYTKFHFSVSNLRKDKGDDEFLAGGLYVLGF